MTYPADVPTDDPEVLALLDVQEALLEAMRRLLVLTERLLSRASLTDSEARDARHELDVTHESLKQLEAMLTLRRQHMRPM
jgi:hypothetical protein